MLYLFCGDQYYPRGGALDFVGTFDDIESAMNAREGQWAQLVLISAVTPWQVVRRWRRDVGTERWITEEA